MQKIRPSIAIFPNHLAQPGVKPRRAALSLACPHAMMAGHFDPRPL
jgi:hypothetical protein